MASFLTIKQAIATWVESTTSLSTIWSFQNYAKRPNGIFELRLDSHTEIGEDYVGPPNDLGFATVTGNREFTLMIMGYGPDIIERTTQLRDSLRRPTVLDTLREAGLVVVNRFTVQNISGLENSKYEERSSLDILMRMASVLTGENVGAIEEVNAAGTLKNPVAPDVTRTFSVEA